MSKKKILIHSIVFSPDAVSTAYLYNDIAIKFAESNYEVVVLTTTPHYNVLSDELSKQPLQLKWGGLYYQSDFKGIKVIHVPQKKFKSSLLRIFGFVYWHFVSMILGLMQKNVSLILSPSPPLTIGFINIIIAKLKRAKVIYNVQEIYPDFLINQKSLRTKPIISVLKKLEMFVYNHSDAVVTIDDVFYNTIVSRFKQPSKLHIIPNFVDTDIFKPISPANSKLDADIFPHKPDTLKIMYAGNIGHAQDWEILIYIAEKLIQSDVEFFVIGEGVMKSYLEGQVQKGELKNIKLIDYQSRDKMPQLLAYADLHFIFMTKEMDGQGFPSKVYTIMACKKALLIVSRKNTPIENFLQTIDCAYLVSSENFEERCDHLVNFIKDSLQNIDRLKEMGENGYALIEENYSKKAVTQKYVDLVDEILTSKYV